ncbi:hypothetical protein CK203_067034 [Vitis vinifera]|uniref:Reverse transcriptase zinc-binding domain-containing protein n=1 Tax=Vitis vinifera TaxID=29760 RepID=A0A438F4U6_VITVI|nr:hypothetical protein CK203_067034 [Vitis vinifera]
MRLICKTMKSYLYGDTIGKVMAVGSIKTSPTHCNFRNPSQFQIEKPSSEASRVPISMAKKRKSDATRLDEVDRTMYTSFCSAANSLSQLYTQAMNQQRLSFQAGERHALGFLSNVQGCYEDEQLEMCNEGGGSWSPLFSSPFNDWELEGVCSFFVALNRKQIQQGVDDRVIWRETNCGKFSVKSLYKSLVSGHPISFPSSAIWKVTVQPRVSFFGWEATWGKTLTLDQLQRRGWALANRCYVCQRHEESIDHILLHCDKTRTLWVLLFSMFRVQWVLPATVKETLSGWNGSFVGKKRKGVWKASPLCLFWTVWKTRNKVAFEEEELSIQRLKASFVYFLWLETKRSIKDGPSTLVDFVGWVASR